MGGDTNELEHHGVKGMRWGVRRQKKRPRFTRPFLNKRPSTPQEITSPARTVRKK